MAANSSEVLHDFFPLLREYKDGRVERLVGKDLVPASVDPETGVQTKDVVIAQEINLSARLYLPKNAAPGKKLPLLVYFHGGGFLVESAFSAMYQKHLNLLVAEANCVAVSVNYRLAPEHPLPAAYDDSWLALKWVASQSTDEWIKDYADLNRVYLGGDSAGGTIAHHVAIRVGDKTLDGIRLSGVFLNCPFFCSKDAMGKEETYPVFSKSYLDRLWHYACPSSTEGSDHPWINPTMDPKISSFGCKRLLVYVAEKDVLRERGWWYKDAISKSGWNGEIEVVEVKGEDHVFSVISPTTENGIAMLKRVASFLNHD